MRGARVHRGDAQRGQSVEGEGKQAGGVAHMRAGGERVPLFLLSSPGGRCLAVGPVGRTVLGRLETPGKFLLFSILFLSSISDISFNLVLSQTNFVASDKFCRD